MKWIRILTDAFHLDPERHKKELAILAKLVQPVKIPKDIQFVKEGEPANFLYLVTKGHAQVMAPTEHPKIKLYRVSPMDLVGWSSIVEPRIYTGNVITLESSEFLRFEADILLKEMEQNSLLGYAVLKRISEFLSQRLLHSLFDVLSVSATRNENLVIT